MPSNSSNRDRTFSTRLAGVIERTAFALTPRSETWLVLSLPLVLFLGIHAIRTVLERTTGPLILTSGDLLGTIGLEFLLILLLLPILRARGWTLAKVTRPWRAAHILHALGLLLLTYAVLVVIGLAISLFATKAETAHLVASRIRVTASPPIIGVVSILNPLFEEFYFLGYTITALKAWGGIRTTAVSVGLRLLFHLYQGPLGVVGIAPFAIVLTLYYQRTRTLWPLLIAHTAQDLLGLFLSRAS